ncbi:hypothetical protein K0651_01400 [Ornithinimicrobium sp. Arc0846-15]|nr:hypothetical protein [Ornithinimicrobium laminariae]
MSNSDNREFAWWQKALIALKIWTPPHITNHHHAKEMERPAPPPVTGAYGNEVVTGQRPRLVPQRKDQQN